jgi:hypothetical protein
MADLKTGETHMAGKKLTIHLTADQQKQIKDATGSSIKELNIDLTSAGQLAEEDLSHVAGGGGGTSPIKYTG